MTNDRAQEGGLTTKEERTWAMFAHLSGPIGTLASAGLLGFLVPLVVYLARRHDSEFASDQAREALNWQITLALLHIGGVLAILLTIGIGALIVLPLFFVLWILELVLGVVAGLQAYEGHRYRYPFALRLLS
jgi:uncharacterized Tic20 family protein